MTQQSLNVLILNRWLGHMVGGVETHIRQIVRALISNGHNVTIITSGTEQLADLPSDVNVVAVKSKLGYFSTSAFGPFYAIEYVARAIAAAIQLKRSKRNFDCALALFSLDGFALRFVRLFCGWPYSVLAQENTILEIVEVRSADVGAFTNEGIMRLSKTSEIRPAIIPFSIDDSFALPITTAEYENSLRESATLKLISVGRLDPRKDQRLLLKAAEELKALHVAFDLTIYGDGELRKALEQDATAMGLDSRVCFAGTIRGTALAKAYRAAHLLVMTSVFEGFGAVYLEAMQAGIPIMATSGGATEAIVGDAGVIIRVRDPKAIAAILADLHHDHGALINLQRRSLLRARAFSFEKQRDLVQQWVVRISAVKPGGPLRRLPPFCAGLLHDLQNILRAILFEGAVRWRKQGGEFDLWHGRVWPTGEDKAISSINTRTG